MNDNIVFSAGWVHAFRAEIEGPIGHVPGSRVKMDAQVDSILAGITIQYGAPRRATIPTSEGPTRAEPPMIVE
jgi:hypothetical protein